MSNDSHRPVVSFCSDGQLAYLKYQTEFVDGRGLLFDESYRLAHLPLVAPDHPRVIPTKLGTKYNRGMHEIVYSIALPIHANQLLGTQEFESLCDELKASAFSRKLSWNTFTQRKNKLHATICGALSTGEAPEIERNLIQQLEQIGPVSIKIRGLFSGNLNVGRLYLKVYPELRDGHNVCHLIQQIFDTKLTSLYVIGLFNLVDELDVDEARELKNLLRRWQDTEFAQIELTELWLLKSCDDLVLNGGIEQVIPIV